MLNKIGDRIILPKTFLGSEVLAHLLIITLRARLVLAAGCRTSTAAMPELQRQIWPQHIWHNVARK